LSGTDHTDPIGTDYAVLIGGRYRLFLKFIKNIS
jgi:hypothetical protein